MPRLYDIGLDDFREATQDDLDNFMLMNRAFGEIVLGSRKAESLEGLQALIETTLVKSQRGWKFSPGGPAP